LVPGDAHHITQPCPQARGPILAMDAHLRGQPSAEDVNYINARHATSTPW
jgi:3-oxoacyl-(acyl-carrier-protein) synthase